MEELHRLSAILIERETIDKDQFLRLLEGASEEEVFPEEAPAAEAEEAEPRAQAGSEAEAVPGAGRDDAAASPGSGQALTATVWPKVSTFGHSLKPGDGFAAARRQSRSVLVPRDDSVVETGGARFSAA